MILIKPLDKKRKLFQSFISIPFDFVTPAVLTTNPFLATRLTLQKWKKQQKRKNQEKRKNQRKKRVRMTRSAIVRTRNT